MSKIIYLPITSCGECPYGGQCCNIDGHYIFNHSVIFNCPYDPNKDDVCYCAGCNGQKEHDYPQELYKCSVE